MNRIQLKGGSEDKKKKSGDKRDFVQQDQIDRRKKDSHCFKYGRINHQATDCEYGWLSKTPPLKYGSNHNQEPVNKNPRMDKRHL